ncbi:hypothetical protein OCU04_001871 [Sclerotinia nivalis]|uniref:Uncharacterized protein n=1 Tax=Sclerotinia nivalis TaxID=352851 RepID=A0A9X0AZY9_9HELO|nr:hypothetical protein OCU04_001871 [Sclerotinia nivalis]
MSDFQSRKNIRPSREGWDRNEETFGDFIPELEAKYLYMFIYIDTPDSSAATPRNRQGSHKAYCVGG